jgi:RNA polymerase sigma-70 factor, ECF subfamily
VEGGDVVSSEFEQWLTAAKAGDESAFVALFRSVQPALLRYLTTLGGGLAEDVASETWVSVVRGLGRFSGDEAGWRAWVFTIARSRLYDAQRRAARSPVVVADDGELASCPDGTDVAARVEEIFSTEAALALIRRLPRDQGEAVLLRHVAGLDVAQTAKVLGKRAGAVRVAAHRGLRRLAELLDQTPEDRGATGCNGIDATIGT